MWSSIKEVKKGDIVHVASFNHTGKVIDIKDGTVYSINDKNVVCKFTDKDKFKIVKKIGVIAKFILDLVNFLIKRPKSY